MAASPAHGRTSAPVGDARSEASLGHQFFLERRYDEAVDAFRRYLRRFPKDYNVWTELAASYYHVGLPKRSLRLLKQVEKKTPNRRYNAYYQGLCLVALSRPEEAKAMLSPLAQRASDDLGSRAAFELAVLAYKARDKAAASGWLKLYLQKSPGGPYAGPAAILLKSLHDGQWLDLAGLSATPDMEEALYKYNQLSLWPRPHFWFVETGWRYVDHEGEQPLEGGQVGSLAVVDMAALLATGAGVGPLRYGPTTLIAGYVYRQLWNTDQSRVQSWEKDPGSVQLFPFQSDLLERHHQVFFDLRRDAGGSLYYGLYGRYEVARQGSSLIPAGDPDASRRVLGIADTTLLIPWVGATFGSLRTLAYLYLRKEINDSDPAFSNKTYSLLPDPVSGAPVSSLGVSSSVAFPQVGITANAELFHYEFLYNDHWQDYHRNGAFVAAEAEPVPNWFASLLAGFYEDQYIRQIIKSGTCSAPAAAAPGEPPAGGTAPVTCPRDDHGLMGQLAGHWNITQFHRVTASALYVENKDDTLKEYNEAETSYQVTLTFAFPSVQRVARIVDRYADTAFTKAPQ